MVKWDLLLSAYLKRDEAEWVLNRHPPTPDMEEAASLLGPDGEQTMEGLKGESKQVDMEEWHRLLCNRGRM